MHHSVACSSALASGEDGTTSDALVSIGVSAAVTSGVEGVESTVALDSVVSTTEGSSVESCGFSSGVVCSSAALLIGVSESVCGCSSGAVL